jgi:intracellular sulfur oxidation DsrE/DsrF family protein
MKTLILIWLTLLPLSARAEAPVVNTPYAPPRVVYDIFLDHPAKLGAALYWLRSLILPLSEAPYEYNPETIKVVLHGTELVAVARKNEVRYREEVARMRYYAELGIEFKVCALALQDYGYRPVDMQDFVQVVPSAMAELVHWQNQGYALLTPQVLEKRFALEEIR